MKQLKYGFICGIIGLIAGVFFGLVFDSFYTKKSQLETKQTLQAYIFGAIGLIGGISLGIKLGDEEQVAEQKVLDDKKKQLEYEQSLIETACGFCNNIFSYSTLQYQEKKYCKACISKIRNDYRTKFDEIDKLLLEVKKLKRSSAINLRFDKIIDIANDLGKYENVELEFISLKPSSIIKQIESIRMKIK